MSDLIWFIMTGILFAVLCLVFTWLGWQIWQNQKMDLIISYHCDKVSEENKQAYCRLAGIGVFVMGTGFGLSAICTVFTHSAYIFIPMAVGLVSGTALLMAAVIMYNH